MKKITKAAAAKVNASNKANKKVKKVNLAEVGKKKPGRKAKDEDKKKKVNLVEASAKKRGRKSNAEKAAEQAAIDKAAKKALDRATKLAQKANGDAEPKKRKGSKVSAYDWALANIKKPNDAAARKLQPGDVIEVFYNDSDKPTVEVVVASCERNETIYDVITVMQEKWQAGRVTSLTKVNSDMWRKIGTLAFKVKKD